MNKLYFSLSLLVILILACKPTYNVLHVNQQSSSKKDGFFYYLPKTTVVIDVEIRKTNYIAGPYAAYSEQYLGYSGITQNSSLYEIENIVITDINEPDGDELYYIETEKKFSSVFELEENGIIRNVNFPSTSEEKKEEKQEKDNIKEQNVGKQKLLNLISIREKLDTIYQRQILEDSVVVEKRLINRVMIKNSIEQSAKEAANKIVEIRSNINLLISYNEDVTYEAGTLSIMIEELKKMEAEYFKLFLGYTETEKINYRFYFKPNKDLKGFIPLFKFNNATGVNDSLKLMMETVYITQDIHTSVDGISIFKENSKEKNKKTKSVDEGGLSYRVPENATFKIIWNNKVLAKATIQVAQFGSTLRLPKYDLKRYKIIYDPHSGNIKSLEIRPK